MAKIALDLYTTTTNLIAYDSSDHSRTTRYLMHSLHATTTLPSLLSSLPRGIVSMLFGLVSLTPGAKWKGGGKQFVS